MTEGSLRTFLSVLIPTGYIELRAFGSGKCIGRVFAAAGDMKAVETFCEEHWNNDVYFGVIPRLTKADGTASNCGAARAVWIDIDFKTSSEAIARKRVSDFTCQPSIIVHSGGGLHCYWLLTEPLESHQRLVWMNRKVAGFLGGDIKATDTARILRLPGTLNCKPEYGIPRHVVIERFNALLD